MKNLEQTIREWLSPGLPADGQLALAAYSNDIALAQICGSGFHLPVGNPWSDYHVLLQLYEGELQLTLDGEPVGFDMPVLMDFLLSHKWHDLKLKGDACRACLLIVRQEFFLESTASLRAKVVGNRTNFVQQPFAYPQPWQMQALHQLTATLFAVLSSAHPGPLHRELIQSLLCAGQCESWNIVFGQAHTPLHSDPTAWHGLLPRFLHLAHEHCRKHHEVAWYARQIGISPDTLSAQLKRQHGKTASSFLSELLVREAKVCLRNPSLSVQQVAETLGFSDQSAFGKFFKRECGVSPAQYRKEHPAPAQE